MPASLRAEGNTSTGIVSIYNERLKLVYYAHYTDIVVDEAGTPGSVEETIRALNAFIGNFRCGGSSSSTTECAQRVIEVSFQALTLYKNDGTLQGNAGGFYGQSISAEDFDWILEHPKTPFVFTWLHYPDKAKTNDSLLVRFDPLFDFLARDGEIRTNPSILVCVSIN